MLREQRTEAPDIRLREQRLAPGRAARGIDGRDQPSPLDARGELDKSDP
jgi:hypothetical protein